MEYGVTHLPRPLLVTPVDMFDIVCLSLLDLEPSSSDPGRTAFKIVFVYEELLNGDCFFTFIEIMEQ